MCIRDSCSTKTEYMTGFTSVEIPEGVETIGDNAFAGNNFTEIVIPSTVKSIGKYAFSTKNTLNEMCIRDRWNIETE